MNDGMRAKPLTSAAGNASPSYPAAMPTRHEAMTAAKELSGYPSTTPGFEGKTTPVYARPAEPSPVRVYTSTRTPARVISADGSPLPTGAPSIADTTYSPGGSSPLCTPLSTTSSGLMTLVCTALDAARYVTVIGRPWLATVAACRSRVTSSYVFRIGVPLSDSTTSPGRSPAVVAGPCFGTLHGEVATMFTSVKQRPARMALKVMPAAMVIARLGIVAR